MEVYHVCANKEQILPPTHMLSKTVSQKECPRLSHQRIFVLARCEGFLGALGSLTALEELRLLGRRDGHNQRLGFQGSFILTPPILTPARRTFAELDFLDPWLLPSFDQRLMVSCSI